jgi:hypothetical protein
LPSEVIYSIFLYYIPKSCGGKKLCALLEISYKNCVDKGKKYCKESYISSTFGLLYFIFFPNIQAEFLQCTAGVGKAVYIIKSS